MQLDGSNIKQFTHEGFYETSQPSLSPDGKNLVMMTEGMNTSERIAVYSIDHPEKTPSCYGLACRKGPVTIRSTSIPNTCQMERAFFSWPPAMASLDTITTSIGWTLHPAIWKSSLAGMALPTTYASFRTEKGRFPEVAFGFASDTDRRRALFARSAKPQSYAI